MSNISEEHMITSGLFVKSCLTNGAVLDGDGFLDINKTAQALVDQIEGLSATALSPSQNNPELTR